jgi:hypothetical protein
MPMRRPIVARYLRSESGSGVGPRKWLARQAYLFHHILLPVRTKLGLPSWQSFTVS